MSESQPLSSDQLRISAQAPLEARPSTFYDLMLLVGVEGRYQNIITLTFSVMWYVTGIVMMSTAFLFLNPSFDCEGKGLLTSNCQEYVCQLPQDQWEQYVDHEGEIRSLANSLGETFFCDDEVYLNLAATSVYAGALVGYSVTSFFADNWGRKKTMIGAWSIGLVGVGVLLAAQNMVMAAGGNFLLGLGTDSILNISLIVISEVYEETFRQKLMAGIQGAFTFGALFITLIYYLTLDWWTTTLYAVALPMLLTWLLLVLFLVETPMFLVRSGATFAARQLNRIGRLNKGVEGLVRVDDIEQVMEQQEVEEHSGVITPLDICRFPSLRVPEVCGCVFYVATYVMYYGPTLIVDKFGFDIYTSNLILNVSDLLTYTPLFFLMDKLKRRQACIVSFGIATAISALLLFLSVPDDCGTSCPEVYVQLAFIFVFRFCISGEFAIIGVYSNELFPSRARSIGVGIMSVFGTVASTTIPLLMGALSRAGIDYFILFTATGIFGTASFTFVRETYGVELEEEIEELKFKKEKGRLASVLSGVKARTFVSSSQKSKRV